MERELVEVFITHVENEGPLLKLWAQTDLKTPAFIERTINQLTPQFEEGIGIVEPSSLSVGQLCCAKYSDGIYYRARITSLANLSNSEVAVQFADYGNLETIALHNMRSFEGLHTVLSTIADQAIDFYVAGIIPRCGQWTADCLKFVRDIICYVELKCLYVGQTEGVIKHLIKLIYHDVDFANVMINQGICVTILLPTQIAILQSIIDKKSLPALTLWPSFNPDVPPPLPVAQLMVTTAMAKACEKNLIETVASRTGYAPQSLISLAPTGIAQAPVGFVSQPPPGLHRGASYPPGHPPPGMVHREYSNNNDAYRSNQRLPILTQLPPPVEVAASFEMPRLEINTKHEVRVAFVEDGPDAFVVSPSHLEVIMEDMIAEINKAAPTPLKKLPMTGSICLGRYSKDNSLCRAVVTKLLTDSCVVNYVDFGHSETLPFSEIFELPQKCIKNPSVMAIRFSHARVPDLEFTKEVKRLFSDYVTGKYFTLCVVPSEGHHLIQYGVLLEKGKPVLEIVRDMVEARKICEFPKITTLQKGATKSILVSFVESVNHFFIQLEDSTEKLTALMSDVLAHCEGDASKLTASSLRGGLLCCAQFAEDGQWYRAQITKVAKDGIHINYVDYGNTEVVQLESLREIKLDLVTHLKAQAVCCCLKSFKDVPVSDALIDQFSEMTTDKNLIMRVVEVGSKGCLIVELHDVSISPPLSLDIELQKYAQPAAVEKPTAIHPDRTLYLAPTPSYNDRVETRPVAESRFNEQHAHGGSGDSRYTQGSRSEASTDWRSKGDDRPGGNKGGGGRDQSSDKWAKTDKIDTWEGSNENSRSTLMRFPPLKISIGDTRSAQLIYAENPEDFYVQVTPDQALTELMAGIAEAYGDGRAKAMRSLSRGAACIAQYSEDDLWYRASVLSVDDDKAKVQFVDYGNSDHVALENIKEVAPEFTRFPAQAVRCALSGSLPKGSKWSDGENNDFLDAMDGKQLEVRFVSEKNGLYAVVVKDVETGKVMNEQFGAPAEAPAYRSPPKPEAPAYRSPAKPEAPAYRSPPKPVATLTLVKETPVRSFARPDERLKAQEILDGTVDNVCVCWFVSPTQFFVQRLSQAGQLDKTMCDIQAAYSGTAPNVSHVDVGSPVVAKYRGDNSLCRAEVLSHKDAPTKHVVRYVDYGNCDVVDQREMWQVESRFLSLPKQALLCRLPDLSPPAGDDWAKSNDVDAHFQDEKYECTFVGRDDEGVKHDVVLVHRGASVADELVAKGLASLPVEVMEQEAVTEVKPSMEEPVEVALLAGQTLEVAVPYVEGVAKFYVHLEGNICEYVQSLVDAYVSTPENLVALPPKQLRAGRLCLATSDGQQWYRARIVDCAGTAGIYIVFFDYGDGDEIAADKLVTIPEYLSAYPAQAIECSLSKWEGVPVEPETEDLFKADHEGGKVVIHVDKVVGNKLSVIVKEPAENACDILPLPILVQKLLMCVTHADGPSSLWLQRSADLDALTEQLDEMFAFYETQAAGVEPPQLSVGLHCAAKSPTDKQWYRAQVIEVKPDGVVAVRFVDYGNCEDVRLADVKVLDGAFIARSAFAVEVALPVGPDPAAPPKQPIDLATMTADVEYVVALARGGAPGKWRAELFHNKEALSDTLVQLGLVRDEDYPFQRYVEELTKSPRLVPGMSLRVYVCHPGGPGELWVQHADNSDAIDVFQAGLQEAAENLEVLSQPAEDDLCMAQFSEDGSWYRAMVLAMEGSLVTVRFVDYGNTDVVDVSTNPLKELTPAIGKVEWYAVRCRLAVSPLDQDFSEEAIERFAALVSETENALLAEVVADGNVIDLLHGETSIARALIAEGLAMEYYAENSAFVSHVDSPSDFWIQYQSSTKPLEVMEGRLAEADAFEPLVSMEEGTLCAAQFADEMWYRARIVGAEDEGTAVLFVDYGNTSVATNLRTLPGDLMSLPPLAKRCSLDVEDRVQWTDEATAEFVEMVAEGATPFLVDVVSKGDPACVTLTDMNKKRVDQLLADVMPAGVPRDASEALLEERMAEVVGSEEALITDPEAVEPSSADTTEGIPEVKAGYMTEVIPEVKAGNTTEVIPEVKAEDVVESDLLGGVEGEARCSELAAEDSTAAELPRDDMEEIYKAKMDVVAESMEVASDAVEEAVSKELSSLEVEDGSVALTAVCEKSTEYELEAGEEVDATAGAVEEAKRSDSSAVSPLKDFSKLINDELSEALDKSWLDVVNKSAMEPGLEDETFISAEDSDTSTVDEFKSLDKLISPERPVQVEKLDGAVPVADEGAVNQDQGDSPHVKAVLVKHGDEGTANVGQGDAVCPSTPQHLSAPHSRPMTPQDERIVPGSVGRGISQKEIEKYKFDPEADRRELELADEAQSVGNDDHSKSCPSTPVPREMLGASSWENLVPAPPRLLHNERIVPGSISSGSSAEEITGLANGTSAVFRGGDGIDVAKGIVRLVIEQSEATVVSKIEDGIEVRLVTENGSEREPLEKEVLNGGLSTGNTSEILDLE